MPERTPAETKARIVEGRERWKFASDATDKQRTREKEDLRFLVDHWPSEVRTARAGQAAQAGMPAVPARPCIQVDKLTEPINRVTNQYRASDISVSVVAADDFADLGIELDETEMTLREGLVRRIQREPEADDARLWAFQRAVECGEGYYLVNTKFLPGKSWDKDIYLHRIQDQNNVRLDPAHEQPDGSDANWEFIGFWMPWDQYKAEHPSAASRVNKLTDASSSDFDAFAIDMPDWVNVTDKGAKAVFVVMYWYGEMTTRTLIRMSDGSGVWADAYRGDLPQNADTRDVVVRTIHYLKFDGVNDFALEDSAWESDDMPIVKVVGNEIQPYDGERRVQGMVRPARDSQFGFDAMISKQVETVALTPIPALHVDPIAIEGYESWYAMLNTRTLPYAPSRTYDEQGRQLAPPSRLNADPNLLPIAQSIALFDQSIQATTATSDPALGRTDPTVKSARHAKFLIDESNQGTGQFLDNLLRSMRYEGRLINSLLYPVYGTRPGRLVRILTGEGETESMRVNAPQTPQDAQNAATAAKVGTLSKDARFNVAITLTKNSTLKREQESSFVGALMEANPALITWFGDLFFKNQDGPGHQQMAERAKVMLDPKIQQFLADKDQGTPQIPPQVQQQMAQMREQLQHAEQAMQELAEEARGKKIEAETKQNIAMLQASVDEKKIATDLELARMDNATKIAIAHINAYAKGAALDAHAVEEDIALGHEDLQNAMAREHEQVMGQQQAEEAQHGRDHDVAMQGAAADAASAEAEAGREHDSDMAAQAATESE